VNRRRLIAAAGCACGAGLVPWLARAQDAWQMPGRFARPEIGSDEGGLWALMDREEKRLRRSPFALRDRQLRSYVRDIVCRLAGDHCPDVRVYLVRTPYFNASMAPNGMMQVWTGLMLRAENEAQLAAVLGHEIGHYLLRHSVERLRDAKARAGFAQFLGLFGVVGAVGQLGLVAGMYAYDRDHEREADRVGALLMRKAGYDIGEAAKVWENLRLEIAARGENAQATNPLFATHPGVEERRAELATLAASMPGGQTGEAAWRERVSAFEPQWLAEEVKRGQHEESLALLTRMMSRSPGNPAYPFARGEVYRLRATDADLDAALADYQAAATLGGEPPEAHRGMGFIHRLRKNAGAARESFQRYLDLAPKAPDALMIKSYLEELRA
jgi:predicted Zn-dependent protease